MNTRTSEKANAENAVRRALRAGVLVRPTLCERCGSGDQPRALDCHHHQGYDEANVLNCQWLCRSCHGRVHRRDNPVARGMGGHARAAKLTPERRSEIARKAGRASHAATVARKAAPTHA